MSNRIKTLENYDDKMEEYSRCYYLLIYGVAKTFRENSDNIT